MRVSAGCLLAAAIVLSSASCASSGGGSSAVTIEQAYGALSAESAVGQFLDAAKRNDYQLMSRLFGTRDGPAVDRMGRIEVEQRMFVLAALLRHQSYSMRRMPVAEAEGQQRLAVDMVGTRNGDITVPFITVVSKGRWFVEQIQTEALSGH